MAGHVVADGGARETLRHDPPQAPAQLAETRRHQRPRRGGARRGTHRLPGRHRQVEVRGIHVAGRRHTAGPAARGRCHRVHPEGPGGWPQTVCGGQNRLPGPGSLHGLQHPRGLREGVHRQRRTLGHVRHRAARQGWESVEGTGGEVGRRPDVLGHGRGQWPPAALRRAVAWGAEDQHRRGGAFGSERRSRLVVLPGGQRRQPHPALAGPRHAGEGGIGAEQPRQFRDRVPGGAGRQGRWGAGRRQLEGRGRIPLRHLREIRARLDVQDCLVAGAAALRSACRLGGAVPRHHADRRPHVEELRRLPGRQDRKRHPDPGGRELLQHRVRDQRRQGVTGEAAAGRRHPRGGHRL